MAIPKTLLATLISDLTAQQRIMRTCADRVRELQDAREWADLYACAWQSLAEHRIPPEARPLLIKLLHGDRHQGTAQEIRAVLNLNVDNRSSIG